jgi:Fic family protein
MKKKKIILENRKPYSKEAQELIKEQDQLDLVAGSLLLEGSCFNNSDILRIIKGEYITSLSINEHILIRNYCDIYMLLYEMLELRTEIDEKVMLKLYKAFTKNNQDPYRSSNPVLRTIDYIPPHFKEIEEQLKLLFDFMKETKPTMNPIMRSAYLHNKLIEIYPYESSNFEIARFALEYELMINGFPIIMIDIKEQDYFESIRRYLKTEDINPTYNLLQDLILKKQEFLLSITNMN